MLIKQNVHFEGFEFTFAAPIQLAAAIILRGGIENRICRLAQQECGQGAVGLDIGASYGFVSMVLASAVGPTGRVFSFECDPGPHEALHENIEANEFADRCAPVLTRVAERSADGQTAIDDFVTARKLERLDFIKVDVDGPEFEVLLGARRTLERFRPVLVVELTRKQAEIASLLGELGYTCYDMSGGPISPDNWPSNLVAAVGRPVLIPASLSRSAG